MTKLVTSVRHRDSDFGTTVVLIDTDDIREVASEAIPAVRLSFGNGTSLVCLGEVTEFEVRKRDE